LNTELARSSTKHGGDEKHIHILVEKQEGQRHLGRSDHRWNDHIKVVIKEIHLRLRDCGID
jgi:hypothetical protein